MIRLSDEKSADLSPSLTAEWKPPEDVLGGLKLLDGHKGKRKSLRARGEGGLKAITGVGGETGDTLAVTAIMG